MRLDDIPFAMQTDYIRLTAMTYQSFGLDKNKGTVETVPLFFGTFELNDTYEMYLKTEKFLISNRHIRKFLSIQIGAPVL